MTADPRTYGVGTGDLVDVVVRGRVQRTGPLSITLDVPTTNVVLPYVAGAPVEVWIPAEGIRSAVLVEPEAAPAPADRGSSGLGPVAFAVAIAVLAILGFLAVAQEFQRSACESVAGTTIECEQTP